MISFIIIGRNEGWKLSRCLKSVFETIQKNDLESYEVIYVDSKSTDDSIERAREFEKVKIYQITGECNAAIGRNIGAKEAKGEVLFFIDGDMEIQPDFLQVVYTPEKGLCYPFVSGGFLNYNYDFQGKLKSKQAYMGNKPYDRYESTGGGIFIITKMLWQSVGGMKNKMRKNQDVELGLRITQKGYPLLIKRELIAIHHMVPYTDTTRQWRFLRTGAHAYKTVLFRDHLFNKRAWILFVKQNPSFGVLILSVIAAFGLKTLWMLLLYISAIILRVLQNRNMKNSKLHIYGLSFIIRDLTILFSFVFFFPSNHCLSYKRQDSKWERDLKNYIVRL